MAGEGTRCRKVVLLFKYNYIGGKKELIKIFQTYKSAKEYRRKHFGDLIKSGIRLEDIAPLEKWQVMYPREV